MKFKAAFIIIILLLNFSPFKNLNGQDNYYVKTFTTENGIPHNHVRAIAQDQQGFLWIATWDGLSRYDGYEFKNYYHNPADSNSIAYFICDNVIVDFENNVWVSGTEGVSKYNRERDNFQQFDFEYVNGITLDRDGKIWTISEKGIQKWNYQTFEFEKIDTEFEGHIYSWQKWIPAQIEFDNENFLWFFVYQNEEMLIFRSKVNGNAKIKPEYIGILEIKKYFEGVNNASWKIDVVVTPGNDFRIFGNAGVYRYKSSEKVFFPANENPDSIKWAIVREAYDKQVYYKGSSFQKSGSNERTVYTESYFTDNQKILWESNLLDGTTQTGLTRKIPVSNGFKHYFTELNPGNGLNAFFPVLKDKNGTVWGGATNVNKMFRHDINGREGQLTPLDNETWKLAQRPRALLEDSDGIWIGYFQRLLAYYDFGTSRFLNVILKKTEQEDTLVPQSFVHLKKLGDELLIVGYKDIFKFNVKTGILTPVKIFAYDNNMFTVNMYCITRDPGNGWWIGSSLSRVFHFDDDFNQIAVYSLVKGLFNVEDIVIGDNNDLYISLLGAGMAHLDKATGKSRIYTTADGLSNNTCYGMMKDKTGNIWISTNHGISRFNPKTNKFRAFGPEDGLKIDEFNSDNTFLAPDGEMFFAGMGGVVSFYPDSIDDESISGYIPPLLITGLRVSGSDRYFEKAVYDCDTVQLKKGDNNIKLMFACLDFVNAEKIRYRYRLVGVSDQFTETDHRNRSVNFSSLKPGKYRFEVQSANTNGDWTSKAVLVILIPSYFYQTFWFKLLVIILILSMTGYMIYGYNRRLRLKARQQQDELKLESLRSQMNPHFIFNSLNSINYFISQNDRLSANRYIADFSRLIRSILGNLSQEYIPLSKELESLNDYLQLEHLRFSDKFDYEIVVDNQVIPENYSVFPGMVQPFIENAIWHGVRGLEDRKGFVKITFYSEKPGLLSCSVEDDGVGRKLSEAHKSNLPGKTSRGIGIVLERLKIVNHLRQTNFEVKIEDLFNDRAETGTWVTVEIPVKNNPQ